MRYWVFAIMLVLFADLYAQKQVRNDSSVVAVRAISKQTIEKFKQDREFTYETASEPADSIWERFWDWVWNRIDEILSTKSGRITIWTILVVVALAVIGYFVVTVTGMNKQGLFRRSSGKGLEYGTTSNDIHNISFEDAINDAVLIGNFRLALRLLYLQSLKILSDKGYILWEVNKTNNDYLAEVANKPWKDLFKGLTRKFEYTWYGEMKIERGDFERLQLQFQQFNNNL